MKPDWNIIFNGVSATSALLVAIIAVWAFFFTDLPDTLVRQLHSDVAVAQEELTDLRREKRALEDNLSGLRDQIAEISRDRDQSQSTLETIRAEHDRARAQVLEIQAQRDSYYRNTKTDVVSRVVASLRAEVGSLRRDAELARTLPLYEAWMRAEPEMKPSYSSKREAQEASDEWHKWLKESPGRWGPEALVRELEMGKKWGDGSDDEEVTRAFRKEITNSDLNRAKTGFDTFDRGVDVEALNLFLSDDRKRFDNLIRQFRQQHSTALSKRLGVSLAEGWTDDDLSAEVRRVEGALSDFDAVVQELEQRLNADW